MVNNSGVRKGKWEGIEEGVGAPVMALTTIIGGGDGGGGMLSGGKAFVKGFFTRVEGLNIYKKPRA